ncbi:hypothetical protein HLB44_04990 [Aquincola sp. S2]|uniref:Glycoside hydrolase n=1 Tax=Pseudaquabacterium terrae TaxID=2732868 RepID=A0ABX2EB63_9BURK|nr:hypothetical protein [Aquabacterium terrae]NRF66334.1 hypothetical protein [Aquabacterium terrae]
MRDAVIRRWSFVLRVLFGAWLVALAGAGTAAPAGFSAWADAAGPRHRTSLTLQLQAGNADVGRSGQLFIAALTPGGQWYGFTPAGWTPVSGSFPPYQQVTLGTHTVPLLQATDLQGLEGTQVYAGYGSHLDDLLARQAYARIYTVGGALAGAAAAGDFITFSINVQDFSYPELSAVTVQRIVELHEQYRLPVDIYLSDTMLDVYQRDHPALMSRLTSSPYVGLSYHIRPPKPYYLNYDWANLAALPLAEQVARIKTYESSVVDLATGQPTSRAGGYQQLVALPNARPAITAALQVDQPLLDAAATAFRELGATWSLAHGLGSLNLGDSVRGLYLRPEHYDLKLFELAGQSAASVIDAAFASAHDAAGARAPFFVGAKMHDNDFFAQKSAWNVVYVDGGKRPPWDPALKSALKSAADQAAQWTIYEGALQYAQSQSARLGVAGAAGIAQLRGTAAAAGGAQLHVSGTMHIESTVTHWPNIDALISFFQRAVQAGRVGSQASGMKWSIGADINWLLNEPRAGEVISTLRPLGVEFDVHAHSATDRARCAERIVALGGVPSTVASGLLTSEIDGLREAQVGANDYRWRAQTLWGIVLSTGHGTGSDDTAAGLWRPRSTADWKAHDPLANLVAVGNGGRTLAAAEALANQLAGGALVQPVYSSTINVAPKTLTVIDTSDGIAQIESWAARVGQIAGVRWNTIAATAAAFKAAGALPSRINPQTAAPGRTADARSGRR